MVTPAKGIAGAGNPSFVGGKKQNAGRIELPPTAELTRLQGYASAGGTTFTEPTGGNPGTARHEHEPGEAGVVEEQRRAQRQVADGQRIGGKPRIQRERDHAAG
jgi:hypothetical protein